MYTRLYCISPPSNTPSNCPRNYALVAIARPRDRTNASRALLLYPERNRARYNIAVCVSSSPSFSLRGSLVIIEENREGKRRTLRRVCFAWPRLKSLAPPSCLFPTIHGRYAIKHTHTLQRQIVRRSRSLRCCFNVYIRCGTRFSRVYIGALRNGKGNERN